MTAGVVAAGLQRSARNDDDDGYDDEERAASFDATLSGGSKLYCLALLLFNSSKVYELATFARF
jgi:hypothetical protein